MKKILSLIVMAIFVFILVGCQENIGEFPEVKESQKVEMTAEEVSLLMADVNLDQQIDQAMMLSLDLDMQYTNAVYDWMDYFDEEKIGDQTGDLKLSSKTYFSLSDQIDELALYSENTINLYVETTYLDGVTENFVEDVEGDLNVYFANQYLYYDADVTGLEENEFLENGQFKLNFGITQEMWNEIYQSPNDLTDEYLDIEFMPEDLLNNSDIMAIMLDADMLTVYKDGNEYTFILEITKTNVSENHEAILDAFLDTEGFTQEDYDMAKDEIEDMLANFTELEILFGIVVEQNLVKKVGIDIKASYSDDEMSFDIIGKLVFDMAVDMPNLPNNLDEYELTDLQGFMNN